MDWAYAYLGPSTALAAGWLALFVARAHPRHRFHVLAILSAPLVFGLVLVFTRLNPIYAAAIGLVAGFFATCYCRPDLWRKMLVSGGLFFLMYFIVFALFNLAVPGYVVAIWNLAAISGLRLASVPMEELMFASTFGLYWSSVYEHLAWRASRPLRDAPPRRPPEGREEHENGTATSTSRAT